eukprot:CAMPEP_0119142468 /NCGR_PEP_ID=MMETSP1310-20130426/32696_1 /TAXON_ID=464262 /ORGANISM="Genus nov. species nov., Strain RCC2339" /LENGTH=47 /DNA_ID= /DNA_START= /DNA_END= /DNA_ORIENTATION=
MTLVEARRTQAIYGRFVIGTDHVNQLYDGCRNFASNLPNGMEAPRHL